MLGKYIMLAVNAPKKYPKQPVSADSTTDGGQMTEDDEAKINALMGAFARKTDKLPSASEKPQETGDIKASGQ